jgi:hypothetical protein
MTPTQQSQNNGPMPGENVPWFKQFWPWFIIALPAAAVIASFVTLWLAISNPDQVIVTDDEYRQLKSELKAQAPAKDKEQAEPAEADSSSN